MQSLRVPGNPRESLWAGSLRSLRLDALLAQNRANVEAAQARARERKIETLKQLRASQPRTERDLR